MRAFCVIVLSDDFGGGNEVGLAFFLAISIGMLTVKDTSEGKASLQLIKPLYTFFFLTVAFHFGFSLLLTLSPRRIGLTISMGLHRLVRRRVGGLEIWHGMVLFFWQFKEIGERNDTID